MSGETNNCVACKNYLHDERSGYFCAATRWDQDNHWPFVETSCDKFEEYKLGDVR